MSSLKYQTSVFQDTRISPDVIPDSFTQINKCHDIVNGYADVEQVDKLNLFLIDDKCIQFHQEGHFQHNIGQLCTPDGSDSSGLSEKAASSEVFLF